MKVNEPKAFRSNLIQNLNKILKNDKLATNVEKGIFNYTIKTCKERNIVRKWDNKYFVQIYIDRFKSIYLTVHLLNDDYEFESNFTLIKNSIKNDKICKISDL